MLSLKEAQVQQIKKGGWGPGNASTLITNHPSVALGEAIIAAEVTKSKTSAARFKEKGLDFV